MLMVLLLGLWGFLLVLIVKMVKGVRNLQRLRGGVGVGVGAGVGIATNEPWWRVWTGIIHWSRVLFGLKFCFCVKVITV